MLCIARVDDKERLSLAHALAFGDADSHQLPAHLWCDGHVRLSLQFGTEFHGYVNILFLNRHRLKR